jgi:drug/metabolite transporter superfamily protein YnfA
MDAVRNVARFDAALWRGKGEYSVLQKCGFLLLALFFLVNGAFLLAAALGILNGKGIRGWNVNSFYTVAFAFFIAAFCLIIGGRLFFNWLGNSNVPRDSKPRKRP